MITEKEDIISCSPRTKELLLRRFEYLSAELQTVSDTHSAAPLFEELTEVLRRIEESSLEHDLFQKYELEVKPGGFVQFVLPAGTSFHEMFAECNEHSIRRWGREAVHQSVFDRSSKYVARYPSPHEIVGVVPGSVNLTRMDQGNLVTSRRLLIPTLESAAAAAALYFCRTGEDLFQGLWVRTAGEVALVLDQNGIEADAEIRNWNTSDAIGCAGTPIVG